LAWRTGELAYHFSLFPRMIRACHSLGARGGWLHNGSLEEIFGRGDFHVDLSDLSLPFCLVRHDQHSEKPWSICKRSDFNPDGEMILLSLDWVSSVRYLIWVRIAAASLE